MHSWISNDKFLFIDNKKLFPFEPTHPPFDFQGISVYAAKTFFVSSPLSTSITVKVGPLSSHLSLNVFERNPS